MKDGMRMGTTSLSFLSSLSSQLDDRLAARSGVEPEDAVLPVADVQTAARLVKLLEAQLHTLPLSADPPLMIEQLHCLACLAALSSVACSCMLEEPNAVVALAIKAAAPAKPGKLALPVCVQHNALMLLVNLSVTTDGAKLMDTPHRSELESWTLTLEDPRSRSLARCALDNIAQHAGLVHHLTLRAAPGKLQLVAPARMLAAFSKLEHGMSSDPPTKLPGNRKLPEAMSAEQAEEAIERGLAAG